MDCPFSHLPLKVSDLVPKPLMNLLVYGLPLFVVGFAVAMGGFSLTYATGDSLAADVLWWIAMGLVMLSAADLILLVTCLGINQLSTYDRKAENSGSHFAKNADHTKSAEH